MKNIYTIMKKELARFFKDPRLVIVTVLFPGLMIYGMYSLMGSAMANETEPNDKYIVEIYAMPNQYSTVIENFDYNFDVIKIDDKTVDEKRLKEGIVDVIVIFDENFTDKIALGEKPSLAIYFNPSLQLSSEAYSYITIITEAYRNLLIQEKYDDVSMFNNNTIEIFEETKLIASIIAMLLPFLIITFLFSGAMSVAPESIAGEKERGTIATLLVTPTKRSEIALGKIISLSIIATVSALSSFVGILLSLPKLMGMEGVEANIYGIKEYLFVLAILIVTVLVIVSAISIISAFAKNVKEASMFVLPLLIVSMIIGITSMFGVSGNGNNFIYLIPLYNSVQMLTQIFTFEIDIVHFLITIISNIIYTGILIYVLTLMFNNEKIMFTK